VQKTQINPWTWQDAFGFSQGWRIDGCQSIVFVSGQGSISADHGLMHEGNFAAQARVAFENLRTVLEQAGASLGDVVKLGVFLVGMEHLPEYGKVLSEFFEGQPPASTLVGVSALAQPGMMLEVEAYAVL
jgi:enamine deaminase RidA (YjgF/YER057c/UK114 family)